jgi:hypothetical protein
MLKASLIAVILVLGSASAWWASRRIEAPLPGPPVSSPIASVEPAISAAARGLPTPAPVLGPIMPAVASITVQARAPAEDDPLYKDPFSAVILATNFPPIARFLVLAPVWSLMPSAGSC